MAGPIKPSKVQDRKTSNIPGKVFDVFNDLIAKAWDGHSATVMQGKAAKEVARVMRISVGEVFDRGYLDVEAAYRKMGWRVEYDKPGFNETYEASFTFKKGKK